MEREKESGELLAAIWNTDTKTALESYRASQGRVYRHGHPDRERGQGIPRARPQILGLPRPVPPSSVFDFSLQREVNKELGLQ
jgi:hypothetical protein